MKENFTISFNWETKEAGKTERIGSMYCFKNCDVNKNYSPDQGLSSYHRIVAQLGCVPRSKTMEHNL